MTIPFPSDARQHGTPVRGTARRRRPYAEGKSTGSAIFCANRAGLALIARHLMVLFAQGDEEPNKEFRKRFCRETVDGRPEPRFSGRLIDELLHHPLPDNVRGLERLLHEAITYSSAGEGDELRPPKGGFKVDAAKVRAAPRGRSAAPRGKPGQEELLALLKQERWNVTRVAEIVGMQRSALHRLMKSYGLEREGRESRE